jgi:hypothetical protein
MEIIIGGLIFSLIVIFIMFCLLLIDKSIRKQTWGKYFETEALKIKQRNCNHDSWNCDKQIRVIECTNCGKRSRIDDYVDLFPPKFN